ncbi:leucine-rich repeat transmembrane protein kinase [Striga asiatica]|uniref:Leucine-rich repeat transmembrane protein kinase n=1 Tax=Striga asiatica TaxID=4170 RepID=A0A5A7NYZ7_STRAF|nr:leucine-rich repeat transmembrane protein kinase [Striga asiatica]
MSRKRDIHSYSQLSEIRADDKRETRKLGLVPLSLRPHLSLSSRLVSSLARPPVAGCSLPLQSPAYDALSLFNRPISVLKGQAQEVVLGRSLLIVQVLFRAVIKGSFSSKLFSKPNLKPCLEKGLKIGEKKSSLSSKTPPQLFTAGEPSSTGIMPHKTRPMTALLLFTGVNVVLVSTIGPVYDFVCFLPYWERRRERRRLEREAASSKVASPLKPYIV